MTALPVPDPRPLSSADLDEMPREKCGAKRVDGVRCELPKGHDGLHRVPWVDADGRLIADAKENADV